MRTRMTTTRNDDKDNDEVNYENNNKKDNNERVNRRDKDKRQWQEATIVNCNFYGNKIGIAYLHFCGPTLRSNNYPLRG